MKKLLMISDVALGGGVEALMQDLTAKWQNKYDITVLTDLKCKDFYKYYSINVKHYGRFLNIHLPHPFGFIALVPNKVINKVYGWLTYHRYNSYDIVIAFKEGPSMMFASSLKANKKLAWVHLDYYSSRWTKICLKTNTREFSCMQTFDNVVCVSNLIKKSIVDTIGDPGNLIVRYNPIDTEKIITNSTENIKLPLKHSLRFVTSGRLASIKGYDMLLDACNRLNADGFKYELCILGDGPERDNLQSFIRDNNLSNVTLLGNKHNPFPYIKTADWFISSSRSEGFSLVSQEAAVLDVPLMLTDCSGVRELLGENGEYGIIMDINSASIYENMKRVLLDDNIRKYYKEKIIERKSIINYQTRFDAITKLLED